MERPPSRFDRAIAVGASATPAKIAPPRSPVSRIASHDESLLNAVFEKHNSLPDSRLIENANTVLANPSLPAEYELPAKSPIPNAMLREGQDSERDLVVAKRKEFAFEQSGDRIYPEFPGYQVSKLIGRGGMGSPGPE